jgi:glycosyltransferase involved in cell wall biosynthesis
MKFTPVLIITYYWPPSGGAGVQRWLKLSKYFTQLGIEPIVLTVDPDKASYPVRDNSLLHETDPAVKVYRTSTFEILDFYQRINPRKEIPYAGFTNEAGKGLFKKMSRFVRGNFFVPDARIGWNKFAFAEACRLIEQYHIKHVITTSPPHSTQLVGMALKKKYALQWIADIRDPWTDIYYYKEFMHLPFAKKRDALLEKQTLEQADTVVVVSHDIKRLFLKKSPILKKEKFHVIPNGYDPADFPSSTTPEEFTLLYTGTLAASYKTSGLVSALQMLKESKHRIRVRFVGNIPPELKDELKKESFHHISYTPHVEHAQSVSELMKASLLLLIIPDIPNNKGILTGKLFEYLGSGKPILGIGPTEGEAADLVRKCQAGNFFDYANAEGMYAYILSILSGHLPVPDHKEVTRLSRPEQAVQFKHLLQLP